ncbi:MAG: glycosyltransferase family 4 protein [Fimbriimonadaceae bacterium]
MRVLLIRREPSDELRRWSDDLVTQLGTRGITAYAYESDLWMPKETHPALNRDTSKRLREIGKDYDLVHAMGYRAAWACAEAFGQSESWGYSVYDFPKTRSPKLIERLNQAQFGTCACRAIRNELDGAGTDNLSLVYPSVWIDANESMRSRVDVRHSLGIPQEAFLVGIQGWDERLDLVIEAAGNLPDRIQFLIVGEEREEDWPAHVHCVHGVARPHELIQTCDLWACCREKPAFPLDVLEAMALGIPTLGRAKGGVIDLVAEDLTGSMFYEDETFAGKVSMIEEMSLTRAAYGQAAQVRFKEMFTIEKCASRFVDLYTEALG